MKRSIALLLTFACGYGLGWLTKPEAEPVVRRTTWCPKPEQREEVPPPARYPTPGEMGVVEPYLKGGPR